MVDFGQIFEFSSFFVTFRNFSIVDRPGSVRNRSELFASKIRRPATPERAVHMCGNRQYRSLPRGAVCTFFGSHELAAFSGGPVSQMIQTSNRNRSVQTPDPAQIGSRTFPTFLLSYRGASNANCTKPRRFGHLTLPGTLFREGAKCCISYAKI